MKKINYDKWINLKFYYNKDDNIPRGNNFCIYSDLIATCNIKTTIKRLKKNNLYLKNNIYLLNLFICSYKYEFRKNIPKWHMISPNRKKFKEFNPIMGSNIINLESFYKNAELYTDNELKIFLKENPLHINNNILLDGFHRSFAMMGRIAHNKPYIPFYIK